MATIHIQLTEQNACGDATCKNQARYCYKRQDDQTHFRIYDVPLHSWAKTVKKGNYDITYTKPPKEVARIMQKSNGRSKNVHETLSSTTQPSHRPIVIKFSSRLGACRGF
jgi:hypothetical protein